jgi:hypothetical protein
MIFLVLNYTSLLIILYDTLGYLAKFSNEETDNKSDRIKNDYKRLVYAWAFYLYFYYLEHESGLYGPDSFLADVFLLIFPILRILISLPITGISGLLAKNIFEDKSLHDIISKIRSFAEYSSQESSSVDKKEYTKSN